MKIGDMAVARYCKGKRTYSGKIVGIDKKEKQVAIKGGLFKITRLFDLEYDYVVSVSEEEEPKQAKKAVKTKGAKREVKK